MAGKSSMLERLKTRAEAHYIRQATVTSTDS
jgi:hypothetical protein